VKADVAGAVVDEVVDGANGVDAGVDAMGVEAAEVGVEVAGAATPVAGVEVEAADRACAFGCGGVPPRGAPATGADVEDATAEDPPLGVMEVEAEGEKFAALNSGELKNSRQLASTELGSATYFSYISSTSQSLAPKFPLTEGKPIRAPWGGMTLETSMGFRPRTQEMGLSHTLKKWT
jgi:hypothetical protein